MVALFSYLQVSNLLYKIWKESTCNAVLWKNIKVLNSKEKIDFGTFWKVMIRKEAQRMGVAKVTKNCVLVEPLTAKELKFWLKNFS